MTLEICFELHSRQRFLERRYRYGRHAGVHSADHLGKKRRCVAGIDIRLRCSGVRGVELPSGSRHGSPGLRLGPVAGGLLNATFGNAAEVVISIMALHQGLFVVVRTGLVGSILGQILLVLGTSLLLAGLKDRNSGLAATWSRPTLR